MIYTDYRARTLFTGYKIGLKKGKLYVGVPNTKGEYVKVHFKNQVMTITDYEGFIKWSEWLPDKTWQNNGEDYRLGYFEWIPDGSKSTIQDVVDGTPSGTAAVKEALERSAEDMQTTLLEVEQIKSRSRYQNE